MRKKYLIFLLICFSCLKQEQKDILFSEKEIKLNLLSEVIIDESIIPFSAIYEPKIFSDTILGFIDGARIGLHFFDLRNGKPIKSFEDSTLADVLLPDTPLGNFDFRNDTVFLLFHAKEKIFKITWDGKLVEEVAIRHQIPNHKTEYDGIFKVLDKGIFVSSVYNGTLKEYFKNSTLVSFFDHNGNFIEGFGEFPKAYLGGNLVPSKTDNIIVDDKNSYILNVLGFPQLRVYDEKGQIQVDLTWRSKLFDSKINFFDNDPFEWDFNDQWIGLHQLTKENREHLVTSMVLFKDKDWRTGMNSFEWYVVVLDLHSRTFSEVKLGGKELVGNPYFVFSSKYSEKIWTITRTIESENLYLRSYSFSH